MNSKRRRDGRVAEGGGLLNLPLILVPPVFNSFAGVNGGRSDAVRADLGPGHKANTQCWNTRNARVVAASQIGRASCRERVEISGAREPLRADVIVSGLHRAV